MPIKKLLKYTCIFFFTIISILKTRAQSEKEVFKVVAYQKHNTIGQFNPKAYAYIDQLIYKLITPKRDGELKLLPSTIIDLNLLRKGKLEYRHVKLFIGIGGANKNSQYFSAMAATPTSRKKFIKNTIDFCLQNKLDGVDMDWEYPHNKKDKTNAIALFKDMYKAFTKKGLLLTAAVTYSPDQVRFAKSIEKYVDQINLMVYEPIVGLTTFQEQIDFALKLIHKENLNLKKLVLGLPFYGKNLSNGKTIAYNKIIKSKELGTIDLNNLDYMDINETKTNVISMRSNGLSGIMFWELGFDMPINTSTSLLREIHSVLK